MKNIITGSFFTLLFFAFGCKMDDSFNKIDPPIVDPPFPVLIKRDTITAGSYLGMDIKEDAGKIYSVIQLLRQTKGVSYVNVVSNFSSEITQLRNRLTLYDYILLDQNEGTDSGVQITLENGKVKSIYLNSGEQLMQWPEKLGSQSSVRMGDLAEDLYEKLYNISALPAYNPKFQRILLLTKNLATAFDPVMAQSPQWYFVYKTGTDSTEEVKMYLKEGKLDHIEVNRYKYQKVHSFHNITSQDVLQCTGRPEYLEIRFTLIQELQLLLTDLSEIKITIIQMFHLRHFRACAKFAQKSCISQSTSIYREIIVICQAKCVFYCVKLNHSDYQLGCIIFLIHFSG
ncbi:hypothetical protein FGO68_gene11059 [Halteria grandinella]|uniref:Uncharacterized protein n=1 Tax=Halteria grandinella TaxID=5974 RepID=A0A8J8SUU1_HALGN|nr:hypothetical protein FGO68_gene11059 [Halteria grandinella]